jgi:hypothetical protein
MTVKLRSERFDIQRDMKEEKKSLSDIGYSFKVFERDLDKHRKILHERKLKRDELYCLKKEDNRIKKRLLLQINNLVTQILSYRSSIIT